MMFFALGERNQRRMKMSQWWHELPLFSMLFFITSCIGMLAAQISYDVASNLANIPSRVFQNYQLWRLVTACLGVVQGYYGIISIGISFWWLFCIFPFYEKKYSSINILVQVTLQTILVQVCYVFLIVGLLSANIIQPQTSYYFYYSIGWDPIIILWAFKYNAHDPNEEISFCFLPCPIKRKFIPFIISLFFFLMSLQIKATVGIVVVAFILGALQSSLLKVTFTPLPVCVYSAIECLIPNCIKNRHDFVKVADCRSELMKQCCCLGQDSFKKQVNYEMQGKGVHLGGSQYNQNPVSEEIKQNENEFRQEKDSKTEKEDLMFQ